LGDLFRFFPYQERSALKLSLGVPDIHLVSLRPEVDGLIVPSKLYGIAAADRPIVAVAAADGENAGLLRRHGCGLVVEPGEGQHLAHALSGIRRTPAHLANRRARATLYPRHPIYALPRLRSMTPAHRRNRSNAISHQPNSGMARPNDPDPLTGP
jgi:hypothetical protein